MEKFKISVEEAIESLKKSEQKFIELFVHGSLSVEIYSPDKVDLQQPHEKDEIYLIISGEGIFINNGERVNFRQGDFLFVPAGTNHRFEKFSEDFKTWVFFYGPKGGEK